MIEEAKDLKDIDKIEEAWPTDEEIETNVIDFE